MVVSRKAITDICEGIVALPSEKFKILSMAMLEKLNARVLSFESQVMLLRNHLAVTYEKEGSYKEAAEVLISMPVLTSYKPEKVTEFKMENYLKIASLFLKACDIDNAENYVNRASLLQMEGMRDELKLEYKLAYANILDHKRKFIEAAQRYAELSSKSNLPEIDKLEALKNGILCTILASAGFRRSRMLASFFKDERSASLPLYSVLEHLHMERLIKRPDLDGVDALMHPHQRALTSDGLTLLERAIVEHNLLAASKLYKNVSFDQLGALLQIEGRKAEKIASIMVSEERMAANIDQISNLITFTVPENVAAYDQHIDGLCQQVNAVIESVGAIYKQFAVAN